MGRNIITLLIWLAILCGLGRLPMGTVTFFSAWETIFISFGIGIILSSYSLFFLGMAGLLKPPILLASVFILSTLAYLGWRRRVTLIAGPGTSWPSLDRIAAAILSIVLLLSLILSLTPETGKDALIYHLSVPKHYLARGEIVFLSGNIFASYPLLAEMQYILALFFGDDTLARMMHFCMLLANLIGISIFCRFLLKEHSLPFLSMLIFISIPTVFTVSHLAYNDLFVSFFTLAAIYSFLKWDEGDSRVWFYLCAIFSGAAVSCKYTALINLPLGILGVLLSVRRKGQNTKGALINLSLFTALTFLSGSPFYLKNWLETGNPFYPFLYSLFDGKGWDEERALLYEIFLQQLGTGRDPGSMILLPFTMSFLAKAENPLFDGVLGPTFILVLPFMLGRRGWERPLKVILFFSMVHFLFWASTAQQMRYLIPIFSLLSILSGAIVSRYCRGSRTILSILGGLVLCSLIFCSYYIATDFLKIRPVKYLAGNESRHEFLSRLIPQYGMYQYINKHLPPASRVLLIYMKNLTYLCETECYADSLFEAYTLQKVLRMSDTEREVALLLKEEGFTHLLYDETFLLGELSPLTQQEMILFNSFREGRLIAKSGSFRLDRVF